MLVSSRKDVFESRTARGSQIITSYGCILKTFAQQRQSENAEARTFHFPSWSESAPKHKNISFQLPSDVQKRLCSLSLKLTLKLPESIFLVVAQVLV